MGLIGIPGNQNGAAHKRGGTRTYHMLTMFRRPGVDKLYVGLFHIVTSMAQMQEMVALPPAQVVHNMLEQNPAMIPHGVMLHDFQVRPPHTLPAITRVVAMALGDDSMLAAAMQALAGARELCGPEFEFVLLNDVVIQQQALAASPTANQIAT